MNERMNTFLTYPWALVFGLYYYVIFQLIYLARFGSLNLNWSMVDVSLPIVGIVSTVLFVYFAKRIPRRRGLFFIPFLTALSLSVFGALGGGLLGPVGVLIFGLVPFALFLPLGYWLVKKFAREERAARGGHVEM